MNGQLHPSDAASAALAWLRERSRWRPDTATPVESLARLLGLDVAAFDAALHPGVWGYLEPGEDLIFLRAGLSEAARRFTLAHEIGHAVLHRGLESAAAFTGAHANSRLDLSASLTTCQSDDVEQGDFFENETLSPGQAYNARATVEREANAFAVALLMPDMPFLDTYLAMCARTRFSVASGGVTRRLAKRFSVSEDAALRRLQWLLSPEKSAKALQDTQSLSAMGDDPDQRAAARLEAPALVIAGPGSGKTSTLVARIAYLIEEQGVKPEQILTLTFSRKAAGELRERVNGLIPIADDSTGPYISTIHHFCLDLLGHYGYRIGLPSNIRLASDLELYFLLRQVMREAQLRHLSPPFAPDFYVRDIQQTISRAKDDLIGPAEVLVVAERMAREAKDETQRDAAERQREYALIYDDYQRRLGERQAVDYGDLIVYTARLLGECREIAADVAARWPHMLVDEYQDINRAMGAILRELVSTGSGLWAVGDADQAIYRFRGAEPGIVHRFGETFPGAHIVSLVRNYRSQRVILEAASAFAEAFSQVNGRAPLEATRDEMDNAQPAIRIASSESGAEELAGLARAIENRRRSGRTYRDQVALVRTRKQVEQVVSGLSAHGVPTYTQASALDQDVVRHCVATLSLLSDPSGVGLIRAGQQPEHTFTREEAIATLRDARRQRRAPLELALGASAAEGISPAGRSAMRRLGRMLSWVRTASSVATGISLYCFSFTRIGARLLMDREQNAVEAAAMRRLLELARAFDNWQGTDNGVLNDEADWDGFAEFLRVASFLRLDMLEEVSELGADAVRVMTAHASKGLEFPVVYLPQLVNRRFPVIGRKPIVARVRQASDPGATEDDELSDEASLFYVAMTRARDELVLSYARRYGRASFTVSPFLNSIQQAMSERITQERWIESSEIESAERIVHHDLAPFQSMPDGSGVVFDLSEIETYQRCPRQYAYRYVDNLWSPMTLVSLYSRVLRRASQEVTRVFAQRYQQGGDRLSREEALALVEENWRAILKDERMSAGGALVSGSEALEAYYLRQASDTIENLWRRYAQHEGDLARSDSLIGETRSHQITVNISELAIQGEIQTVDLSRDAQGNEIRSMAEQGGDPWVVVRYQSGRSDTSPTLRDLFAEVAAHRGVLGGGAGRVVARNLATGSVAPVNLSDRQRARITREAMEAALGISRQDFHTTPEVWQCQRCPFAIACPQ